MYSKVFVLSILNLAESKSCNVWTGGFCNFGFWGCPEGSKCIQVGNDKKCGCFGTNDQGEETQGCWKGSTTDGVCVDWKVKQEFSDSDCLTAYTDRCFELPPYALKTQTNSQCCGKCGEGTSDPICHWTYAESEPALQLGGAFNLSSDACRSACDKLQNAANTRAFYCGDEVNACAEAKRSVHDAIRKTKGVHNVKDFCNSDGQSEIECDWQHKRGQTEDKDCGNRVFDAIKGTFRYKVGDNDCRSACEALGDMTKPPADFCNIGSMVKNCDAALNSVKDVPKDWCQDNFGASVPSPAPNNDNICHDAYRAGCWATGAFKSCCGKCMKDEGEMTCHWSFTGPPNLLGDAHTCGQEIGGEFAIENEACFNACNFLSHDVKATSDLCAGALSQDVHMCPEARRSVSTALGKTSWCQAEKEMLNLQATTLAADDAICQAAYAQRCFEKEPFKQCCAQCSSGSESHTCHWTFEETDPTFSVHGSFVGVQGACGTVCQKLNSGSSQPETFARGEYCPGGAIYDEAQKCENAKASLAAVFTDDVCKHQDNAVAQCDWKFSYDTFDKEHASLNGSIVGTFKYSPSSECADACAALGYYNNMPADFCEGTPVWKTVEKCTEARATLEEIKKNALHSSWCDASKSVRVSSDVAIDYKVAKPASDSITSDDLKYCSDSYTQKCFNSSIGQKSVGRRAFDQCCKDCFIAISQSRCMWTVNDAGTRTVKGDFEYYGVPCFEVCESINQIKQATDLCRKDKLDKMISKCMYAVSIRDDVKAQGWCSDPR